jgi:hypothetical protein
MRHRHALYLSDHLSRQLAITAETHHVSKSAILERALTRYLSAATNGNSNGLPALQQEQTARTLRRLERDLAITAELTAMFMRYFLTITPPLPESEHAAARALGLLRFDQVIEEIATRIQTDHSLMARVTAAVTEGLDQTHTDQQRQGDDHATPPSEPVSADLNPGKPGDG